MDMRCSLLSVVLLVIAVFAGAVEATPPEVKPERSPVRERPTPGHLKPPAPAGVAAPLPWLGLGIDEVDDALAYHLGLKNDLGIVVRDVAPGGPAQQMGITSHDVIVAIDGEPVYTQRAFVAHVKNKHIDDTVTVQVRRGAATEELTGRIGTRPPELEAPEQRQPPSWWRQPLDAWRERGRRNEDAEAAPPRGGTIKQPDGSTMEWSIEDQP